MHAEKDARLQRIFDAPPKDDEDKMILAQVRSILILVARCSAL